jgi:hypothetical protein
MPAGGMVAWVEFAFGSVLGAHNMYWFVCISPRSVLIALLTR